MKVYLDFNDWWIGYYRGDRHHYACPLPTLVIRWSRKIPDTYCWGHDAWHWSWEVTEECEAFARERNAEAIDDQLADVMPAIEDQLRKRDLREFGMGEISDSDAEWLAAREAEEQAERERRSAQLARSDLTPLDPAPGSWAVETFWRHESAESDPEPRVLQPVPEKDAEHVGLQLSCCAGIRRLRVIAPDGSIRWTYDREGNFWLKHESGATA